MKLSRVGKCADNRMQTKTNPLIHLSNAGINHFLIGFKRIKLHCHPQTKRTYSFYFGMNKVLISYSTPEMGAAFQHQSPPKNQDNL
jgi:hypothetical protein